MNKTVREVIEDILAEKVGDVPRHVIYVIAMAAKAHLQTVELLNKQGKLRAYKTEFSLVPKEKSVCLEAYLGESDDGFQQWEMEIGESLEDCVSKMIDKVPS